MSLPRIIFPMTFGQQKCQECEQYDEISNLIPQMAARGELIGWKHAECGDA